MFGKVSFAALWKLCLLALLTLPLLTITAAAGDIIIHAGKLIDGTGKKPLQQVSITIRNDRIVSVKAGYITAAGAEIIDLTDKTVLPGLIDAHVHLLMGHHAGDPIRNLVTRTSYDDLIDGVIHARDTLMAGFTSVRDVGDDTEAIIALKKAVAHGIIPGPRMWVAGMMIGPTGGHSDRRNGLNPNVNNPRWENSIVDGPEAVRLKIRQLKQEGVDLIKIMPSGGVMSVNDDPKRQLMTNDEIQAAIETAHSLGLKVAAHAHGKEAIDNSLRLGIDSIEHGTYSDAESYKLFVKTGAYLVPTMLVANALLDMIEKHPGDFDPSTIQKAHETVPLVNANVRAAYKAGVRIAFGTDTFGITRHGENAHEFSLLVKAGLSLNDAILTSTKNAALLIGDEKDIGSVEPGKYADIIAVKGNPLEDISCLEKVLFVMKGGVVVKSVLN